MDTADDTLTAHQAALHSAERDVEKAHADLGAAKHDYAQKPNDPRRWAAVDAAELAFRQTSARLDGSRVALAAFEKEHAAEKRDRELVAWHAGAAELSSQAFDARVAADVTAAVAAWASFRAAIGRVELAVRVHNEAVIDAAAVGTALRAQLDNDSHQHRTIVAAWPQKTVIDLVLRPALGLTPGATHALTEAAHDRFVRPSDPPPPAGQQFFEDRRDGRGPQAVQPNRRTS